MGDGSSMKKQLSSDNNDIISPGEVGEVDNEILKTELTKEVDKAFGLAIETEGIQLDPAKEKKLVRKIDWYILSTMCALMSCQLMGKSSNSYASIIGLRDDLHMTSKEYSWVGSGFYLGYLVFEYPASLILQRFPMSKVLAFAVIAWGVVLCCHGACKSSATFLLCRTLLGILQSFMDPAYMIMTSQWYRKEEQYIRCAYWLGMQGFGTLLGSGIAYGFYTHQGSFSMRPWSLLYIVVGVITIFFGLISYTHVPDIPTKAWFLNEEEKSYVVERIRQNRTGFGNPKFKWSQLKEAVIDPTIYLFFLFMFGYGYSNGALGNYGSIILEEYLDFSTGQSLLMNMVGSGMDIVFPLMFAYINKYFIKSRLIVAFIINAVVWAGLFMLAYSSNRGARTFGYFITYWQTASWATLSSIVQTNVAGYTKRSTANTLFLVGFSVGNLLGPLSYSYNNSEDLDYTAAGASMIGTNALSVFSPPVLFVIYYFRNKKKINLEKGDLGDDNQLSFGDLTDYENPAFRYDL